MPKKKLMIIQLTIGKCVDCGKEVVLINGYGTCECGCPGILNEQRHHNCYVSDDVLDAIGLRRKPKKRGKVPKCWLCGRASPKPDQIIETECETPGGKPCPSKNVPVHTGCMMEME